MIMGRGEADLGDERIIRAEDVLVAGAQGFTSLPVPTPSAPNVYHCPGNTIAIRILTEQLWLLARTLKAEPAGIPVQKRGVGL